MSNQPTSEEPISEALLEDELLAEEMENISHEPVDDLDILISSEQTESVSDPAPTGGDIDVDPELASTGGEEAVGGSASTPEQNNVDEIAASVGVEMHDQEDQYANEMLNLRDDRRWELDPKSSEDYQDRWE